MKRTTVSLTVLALVVGLLAGPASAQAAGVSPGSGPAGTGVTISISDFTPNSTFEVHRNGHGGGLLASGTTNGSGAASVGLTIPADAPDGPFTLFVCETQFVACTDTGNEFWVGTTAGFQVTPPASTTTATTVATTTPTTSPTPDAAGACAVPGGAVVLDFDDLEPPFAGSGSVKELYEDYLYLTQPDHVEIVDGGTDDGTRSWVGPLTEGTGIVADNPAPITPDVRSLGTTSPPNVLRMFDVGHLTLDPWGRIHSDLDYLGFGVGLGHFSEGFERPDFVEFDVTVSMVPIHHTDGTVTPGVSWDPVSVIVGPGAQPVEFCVFLEDDPDAERPLRAFWTIDIVPRDPTSGEPLHFPIEIDDLFFGSYDPLPDLTPAGVCDIPTGAIHVDFDDIPTGATDEVATAIGAYHLSIAQLDHVEVTGAGLTGHAPAEITNFTVRDAAAFDPTASSPPNAFRFFDRADLSVPAYRALHGPMDYFGFNVGFGGPFGEGFENPAYVDIVASITMLPVHEMDGTVVEASWDPVTVRLGPGPQPIETCVYLENTERVGHPMYATWRIDIEVLGLDGEPVHLPVDIDDVFFGTNAPPPGACDAATGATTYHFDDLTPGQHIWDVGVTSPVSIGASDPPGRSYVFGTWDYATIAPDHSSILYDGPWIRASGFVTVVPEGTVSPPYAVLSDGVQHMTLLGTNATYVGLHMGWPDPARRGLEPVATTLEEPLTYEVRVRHLPYVLSDGLATAELGSAVVELGPEHSGVFECVVIPLEDADLAPGFEDIVIEIRAFYRGEPNDWAVVIDDVFWDTGPAPAATHPTAPAVDGDSITITPVTTVTVEDDDGSGLLPLILVILGLGAGGAGFYLWWRRRRPGVMPPPPPPGG